MDELILKWVNGFVGQSQTLDRFEVLVSYNEILKGMPIVLLFLFLWYLPRADQIETRLRLIALLLVAIVAIVVGRGAAMLLPHRDRPILNEALELHLVPGFSPDGLNDWSSFPSDHAVLFMALATCFWMVNCWAGMLAVFHAIFFVCFTRVFLAYHYPSDILGGIIIGVAVALLLMRPVTGMVRRAGILEMGERWPQFFNPALFVVLFQIMTMFGSARILAGALRQGLGL